MPGSTDTTPEQQFREFVHARTPALSRTAYLLTGDAHFEDLTEVEAAAALGISTGTGKSTTRQALGRLRVLAPELAELIGGAS
ncbi:hypothetical protein [Nocardioides sp.]|uniref:hypothetical protein n=1 Tax=Nocardioides sp. TaxID=35761 RepID=UPI001A25E960|nr:hypothetical protein [Nocardioides sp.]MBJ7356516.1 hypothetical protein [Nocardioides sp.]